MILEHAIRIVLWAYCGLVLLMWDGSVGCWILFEAFAIAAGVFIGFPCFYLFKLWKVARRWSVRRKYRHEDPNVCCCGCLMGQGGSICHHGGCRSAKEYAISSEMDRLNINEEIGGVK